MKQRKTGNKIVLAGLTLAVTVLCVSVQFCFFACCSEITVGRTAGDRELKGREKGENLHCIPSPEPGYEAEPDAGCLHAKAAVLMDMDSGRILYEKNAKEVLPMASTTKIMTCITALELGNVEDIVTVSPYAASQPKVHLGMRSGQRFRLGDLLYSLMLESHNDAAVAIAEHIGTELLAQEESGRAEDTEMRKMSGRADGVPAREDSRAAVKAFCDVMTQKASQLGCTHTCFLTPNGLDAQVQTQEGKLLEHSTTAEELARMMSYCVRESPAGEDFIKITETGNYSFSDAEGKHSYSCVNHNAMLQMAEETISGKTGFTGKAGYCYTGAFESDGRHYAIALLACGWPNHKTWKWADCKTLLSYGKEHFSIHRISECIVEDSVFQPVAILGAKSDRIGQPVTVEVEARQTGGKRTEIMLLRKDERFQSRIEKNGTMGAPVKKGERAGSIFYLLNDKIIGEIPVVLAESAGKIDYLWCLEKVVEKYCSL